MTKHLVRSLTLAATVAAWIAPVQLPQSSQSSLDERIAAMRHQRDYGLVVDQTGSVVRRQV